MRSMHIQRLADVDLARIQMQLEYDVASPDRFHHKHGTSQRARFVAYRFKTGAAYYFRDGLAEDVVHALQTLPLERVMNDPAAVYGVLGEGDHGKRVWAGAGYVFDDCPRSGTSSRVVRRGRDFFACVNGQRVAVAQTTRGDGRAAEVTVETSTRHRRHGHGAASAQAWARSLLRAGRIPFYSHRGENRASGSLACALKLRKFCAIAAYD